MVKRLIAGRLVTGLTVLSLAAAMAACGGAASTQPSKAVSGGSSSAAKAATSAPSTSATGSSATAASSTKAASTAGPSGSSSSAAATGGASTPVKIRFQADFLPTGWDTGFWVALEKGYYKAQGLDVTAVMGKGSFQTAEDLASGTEDLAQVDGGTLIQAIDQGLPVIGVASEFKTSPNAVIVPAASTIKSVADLKGKTLAENAGAATAHMMPGVLAYNHLTLSDVKIVNVANSAIVPALLEHHADAIDTSAIGQGVGVVLKGMPTRVFLYDQNGLHTPGYALSANKAWAAAHPSAVARFITASRQGFADTLKDPTAALAIFEKAFPTSSAKEMETQLKDSFPFWQNPPFSAFDMQQYTEGQQEMLKYKVIKQTKPVSDLVTNAYLPK